ncbi:hypothetical protein [Rhizorhapis sp. SPR117]|uniref:hypothetical protein n=1 Tax=Rhizorhapis sp. SPR117 TaxID=2912611 RepID=UPI001F20DE5D|nr:hypothetical protein [Rhizorhapis sp. SPR117]
MDEEEIWRLHLKWTPEPLKYCGMPLVRPNLAMQNEHATWLGRVSSMVGMPLLCMRFWE